MGTSVQHTTGNGSFVTGTNIYTNGWTNTAQGWVNQQNITVSPHMPPNTIYVTPQSQVMSPQTVKALLDMLTEPDPDEVERMIDLLLGMRRKLTACP